MNPTSARDVYFQSGDLRLHALEWGPADAPPMVLLHGLRSYAATWEPLVPALAGSWRMIALDHRGRGDSDWDARGRYFTQDYVSDLEAMVAHLGLQRFVLVGHSMGGTNALVYTGRHPDKVTALVVEDMGPGASASGPGAERIRSEVADTPTRFDDWAAARAFWRARRPRITEAALDSRVRHTLRADPSGGVVWKYDARGITRARLDPNPASITDLWPSVKSLRCPTLLLRGAQSDFLQAETAERMVQAAPVIEWHDIAGASHYVHDDNPEDFMNRLENFLARLPAQHRSSE